MQEFHEKASGSTCPDVMQHGGFDNSGLVGIKRRFPRLTPCIDDAVNKLPF